jgi:hypothetical protein
VLSKLRQISAELVCQKTPSIPTWDECTTVGHNQEASADTSSTTGAPGTAAAGTNGCISNCGTNILTLGLPANFMKLAYFKAYDRSQPCLSSSVTSLGSNEYTYVYLAFASITSDF